MREFLKQLLILIDVIKLHNVAVKMLSNKYIIITSAIKKVIK